MKTLFYNERKVTINLKGDCEWRNTKFFGIGHLHLNLKISILADEKYIVIMKHENEIM